jgi:class 3 adenylate cyclase/tetratricopeptide (TPR) repeat protein
MAEPRRERKVVTVLFADLVGFTARSEQLDPEDVDAVLRPYHERLRAELERWGGTVEKFIGDAVVAVFGAPIAREDDPERALRAALAIRDWATDEDGVEVRIAVNTGEALVSLDARPDSGEGFVAGDVVNTAARLQSAAPVNGILVGEQTQRATSQVIDYGPAEPVVAKGKSEPVAVWEALQARSRFGVDVRQHGGAPLVGRVRELDALVQALERVKAERTPQLLTLVGVPGIGKSRLVWELFAAVSGGETLVYWRQGRSLPYGEGVSFWALAEMVKAQAGVLESDSPEAAGPKLDRAVADAVGEADCEWVASHLRPLIGIGTSPDVATGGREEAFAAWRRLFESLAERRPLVLVFEDLHFADDGLLDFIDELIEWTTDVPLLVVCTARPELLERRPTWGGGKLNSTTLALSPLADDDATRLVGALLGQPVLPSEVQSALLERAAGNPLYAEQFARLFVERGSIDEIAVPETLHGLIAARLDALAPDEKELLQDASVMGKVFWTGALRRPEAALRGTLHSLERKEFVRRERRPSIEGESEYAFHHLLVRDVAYGQIPRGSRGERHRVTAEWIEQLGRPEDHAELVAHHYLAAIELTSAAGGDVSSLAAPARAAASAAGDRAFALNAWTAALAFYEQALELCSDVDAELPRLLLAQGRAAHAVGREDARMLLVGAVAALREAHDNAGAAEAEIVLYEAEWMRGQRDQAFAHLEHALELVADEEPSRVKATVLSQAARFSMLAGRHDAAVELGSEAFEMAKTLGLEEIEADALMSLGPARWRTGDPRGIDDLERGVEIARRSGSPLLARGLINLAVSHWGVDTHRALELHEEAGRAADRMGQAFHRRYVQGGRPAYLFFLGRWDEALAMAERFIAEDAESPHYLLPVNLRTRAAIRLARNDDMAGALEDLELAVDRARRNRDPQAIYPNLTFYADLLYRSGRVDEARAIVHEIFDHWAAGEPLVGAPLVDEIVMLRELAGPARTRQLVDTDAATPRREAALASADGDFLRAAGEYARHGGVYEEARARVLGAEQLIAQGRGREADIELERALETFRALGAIRDIREAEALLAAIA